MILCSYNHKYNFEYVPLCTIVTPGVQKITRKHFLYTAPIVRDSMTTLTTANMKGVQLRKQKKQFQEP